MEVVTARMRPGYQRRKLLWAALWLGMGLWYAYDGFIAWPKLLPVRDTYNAFRDERVAEGLEPEEVQEAWEAYADEHHLPRGTMHHQPGKRQQDLTVQRIIAGALLLIACGQGFSFIRSYKHWVAIEGQRLTTSGGADFTLDQVKELDLRRWDRKGIAVVVYEKDGKRDAVVLDDWKFDTHLVRKIVDAIRAHAGDLDPQNAAKADPAKSETPAVASADSANASDDDDDSNENTDDASRTS